MVESTMLPSMPVLFNRESQDAFGYSGGKIPSPTAQQQEYGESKVSCRGCLCSDRRGSWREELPVETEEDMNEMTLVASYYNKVQARFSSDPPQHNRFLLFQQLLHRFDPYKESPEELLKRVEALFGEEGAELSEEFVLFLTAAQAARVGRLMDHLHLNQLLKFTALLQRELRHKEALLRRVLRALGAAPAQAGAGAGAGPDEWAGRVCSLLRAAPRLHHAFTRLLPAHRPPLHALDSGKEDKIELRSGAEEQVETWELPEPPEDLALSVNSSQPQVTYMHGRVFLQCGRAVRGARVNFPLGRQSLRYHARRLAPAPPAASGHALASVGGPDLEDATRPAPPPPSTRRPQNRQTNAATRKRKKAKLCHSESKEVKDRDAVETVVKHEETKLQDMTSPDNDGLKVTHMMKVAEIDNTRLKIVKLEPFDELGKPDTKYKECYSKKERKCKDHDMKIEETDNLKSEMLKIIPVDLNDINRLIVPETDKHSKGNVDSAKDPSNEPKEQTYQLAQTSNASSQHWTRNEDKIILEVLKGEISSEKTFDKIRELLPNRSVTEIQARFQHVMNLLQEMAASDSASNTTAARDGR